MNENVLKSLASAAKAQGIPAKLERTDGSGVTSFLYNPEILKYNRQAQYAEVVTGGTSIPDQNYIRSTGRTLELSDLLLDSFCAGKSLRQLIYGLEGLLLPAKAGLPPKTVSFVWGGHKFGPAAVTAMSWEETGWLSGEPAQARVDLSLLQVPKDERPGADISSPTGKTELTERQKADGREQAAKWLTDNSSKLRTDVRSAFNSKRFKYLTDDSGNISITNTDGKPFGIVGAWDGFTFTPSEELTK